MRRLLIVALVTLLSAASATAQTDAVAQHFHAYRTALDAGDLTTAEREADAALQASERRDGDGGHTAVLALNLATTRLSIGRAAEALAPAQRARTLAEANANAGVDPRLARLVEAHAAFDAQTNVTRINDAPPGTAAPPTLVAALAAMRPDDPWESDIFSAANDLANAQFAQRQYRDAAATWAIAVSASAAVPDSANAKASTEISLASALIMRGATDGFTNETAASTRTALVEAINTYLPDLHRLDPTEPISADERQYATALGWFQVFRFLVDNQDVQVPDTPTFAHADHPEESSRPVCRMTMHAVPLPRYPPRQQHQFGVGSVAFYWETDETGAFQRSEVIGSVGADFADAVRGVVQRWSMVKADGSAEDCTMATYGIMSVNFDFGSGSHSRSDTLINSNTHSADGLTGNQPH